MQSIVTSISYNSMWQILLLILIGHSVIILHLETPFTDVHAVVIRLKIVGISSTSAVNELQTDCQVGVKIPSGEITPKNNEFQKNLGLIYFKNQIMKKRYLFCVFDFFDKISNLNNKQFEAVRFIL